MTIDPRMLTVGTEHVDQAGIMLAPSAKRREVFGESHEGGGGGYHIDGRGIGSTMGLVEIG